VSKKVELRASKSLYKKLPTDLYTRLQKEYAILWPPEKELARQTFEEFVKDQFDVAKENGIGLYGKLLPKE
jgi:hypothetical protein